MIWPIRPSKRQEKPTPVLQNRLELDGTATTPVLRSGWQFFSLLQGKGRERMAGVIISLSVILSVVLFGSLIPQGLPAEIYLDRYGETMGRLFLTLGMDDIFRTRGFMVVGIILFLQLSVCTWHRLRLLRGGIRWWVAGSVLLHVGLMVFLISVGISLWWGKTVMVEAPEGKNIALAGQGFPFDLQLEKFTIEYYADGRSVRQYRSDISVLQGGVLIKRGSLEVNEPLAFGGVKIFQMSYGWLVEGTVRRLPDGAPERFSVQSGDWVPWSASNGEPLRVAVMSDPDKTAVAKPAAAFLLSPVGGARRTGVVVTGETAVSGDVEIRLERLRRYSGLQLKEDPGVAGIFGGLVLALCGLMLRYFTLGREQSG